MKTLKPILFLTALLLLGIGVASCMQTNNQPVQTIEPQVQTNELPGQTKSLSELTLFKSDNGLYGFRDETGNTILEPKYAEATPFIHSFYNEEESYLAMVNIGTLDDSQWVVINATGKYVVEPVSTNGIVPPLVYDTEELQTILDNLKPDPNWEFYRITVKEGAIEYVIGDDVNGNVVEESKSIICNDGGWWHLEAVSDSIYISPDMGDGYTAYLRKDVSVDTLQACLIPKSILDQGTIKMYDKEGRCMTLQKTLIAAISVWTGIQDWGTYQCVGTEGDRVYLFDNSLLQYEILGGDYRLRNGILLGNYAWGNEGAGDTRRMLYVTNKQAFYTVDTWGDDNGFYTIDKNSCSSLPE